MTPKIKRNFCKKEIQFLVSQQLENNDYSLLRLSSLCIDFTIVGKIQEHQQRNHCFQAVGTYWNYVTKRDISYQQPERSCVLPPKHVGQLCLLVIFITFNMISIGFIKCEIDHTSFSLKTPSNEQNNLTENFCFQPNS